MRELRTDAIILDTTDVFDADRLYLVFTRELGKIRARAKGVRRPTSRLTGHLLRFMPVHLALTEKGGWYLIIQASGSGGSYPADSLTFLQAAELLAEGVDAILVDQEAHPDIYDSLEYVVVRLRETSKPLLLAAEFLFKALCALGYQPELERSVVSGQPLEREALAWSTELGGVLNRVERPAATEVILIEDPRVVVALRQLAKPAFVTEQLAMPPEVSEQVVEILFGFIQFHAGRDLRSLRFLRAG